VIPALRRIASEVDWRCLAERLGIDSNRPFAVIAPGASMPRRVWPTESWSKVSEWIEASGFQIVLLSGPSDKAIAERLHEMNGGRGVLVAGNTDLIESAALLSHANLFLGSDSGPGHLAGALGVPTIVLFATVQGLMPDGASSPERIRPVGPHVVCCCPPRRLSPCEETCEAAEAHCITLIEPDAVIQAAHSALEEAGSEADRPRPAHRRCQERR
jgi:ADP-heptose:LPS heptosyltransferase